MQTVNIRHDYTIDIPSYGDHLDIDRLIDIVKRSGSHFFDADTMRFFLSRVDYHTYPAPDGWYFVTSEKHKTIFGTTNINEPRLYTVRALRVADGDVKLYELEGFQRYRSLDSARRAAKRAALQARPPCPDCRLRIPEESDPLCEECQLRRQRFQAKG